MSVDKDEIPPVVNDTHITKPRVVRKLGTKFDEYLWEQQEDPDSILAVPIPNPIRAKFFDWLRKLV